MEVDQSLINKPPIPNQTIIDHFSLFPIFLMDQSMKYHRKNLHTQPGIEITFTHEGRAAFVVGDQVYMQSAGSLIIVPGHIPHQIFFEPSIKYRRTVICIDTRGLQHTADSGLSALLESDWFVHLDPCQMRLQPETYSKLIMLTRQMQEELSLRNTGWRRMVLAQLVSISVLLQRIFVNDQRISEKAVPSFPRWTGTIEECCEYVARHLQEDLSLQRMSGLLAVSQEHLTRSFQREKGVAYYKYVLMQRVRESKRLLLEFPEMSVTDVAFSVGFSSSTQFCRMFKRFNGVTPSEFRVGGRGLQSDCLLK